MLNMTFMHTSTRDGLETVYKNKFKKVIDFTGVSGIHTMCNMENIETMAKMTEHKPNQMFYLGNGNYHYLTLMLTQNISDPYTLIVFDNHNDAGIVPFEKVTTCGSWIDDALHRQDNLKQVLIIGVQNKDEKTININHSSRLSVIRKKAMNKQTIKAHIADIPTKNVYISIDRDILSPREVETNWNQGTMTTDQLTMLIADILRDHTLIEGDICGDIVWTYKNVSKDYAHRTADQSIENLKRIDMTFNNT